MSVKKYINTPADLSRPAYTTTKTGAAAHGQKSTKVQVRIPDDLLSQLDRVISTSQIANRSEALRMAVELLISEREKEVSFYSPISNLQLNLRIVYALRNSGINLVYQLIQKDLNELLKIPNIGRNDIVNIKRELALNGLSLGMVLND